MNSQPIALLVDDSCPIIHVYRFHLEDVHNEKPTTKDGRQLLDLVPNNFLDIFCSVVKKRGVKGKFTVVPSPAGCGDVVSGVIPPLSRRTGIEVGYEEEWARLTREWVDKVNAELRDNFDFSPEMLTHNFALDLKTGQYIGQGESDWSQKQNRETLTPYIEKALDILKQAGIQCTGVSSPWSFGLEVEDEYIPSIVEAMRRVYGSTFSWYFLHTMRDVANSKPWIAYDRDAVLVSIPTNVDDFCWETINTSCTDNELVQSLSDKLVSRTKMILEAGGWPMWLTHWQSLWSNGLGTGLRVLDEAAKRIHEEVDVKWMKCKDVAKAAYALNLRR